MASSRPSLFEIGNRPGAPAHVNAAADLCPLCDQPIPHERADEIAHRLETLEQERMAEVTAKLTAEAEATKAAALAEAERQAVQRIATARESAAAEAAAEAKARLDFAEAAKANAEAARLALESKLEQADQERDAAVAAARAEAAGREAEVKAEAERAASDAAAAKVAEAEGRAVQARDEAAAQQERLTEAQRSHLAQLEKIKQDAAFKEAEVARETKAAAETAAQAAIAEAQRQTAEAEASAAAARTLAASLEESLVKRLAEQREALESDKADALNREKSDRYEERLAFQTKVDKLQRDLDQKSNEELGEGAHIDLLESLKAEFTDDRIERIKRGEPGADIRHTVMHNGKPCGMILYDSKNHGAWRNDFVTKLKNDQLADQADHAVLVTSAFPAKTRHYCMIEDIIVASPARVVALVQLVRQHMVRTHALRMSSAERAEKTGQLYDFITSPRCAGLMGRFESDAAKLLDLQNKEMQQHKVNWQSQGKLICSIQKAHGDLSFAIDGIIGTADAEECP